MSKGSKKTCKGFTDEQWLFYELLQWYINNLAKYNPPIILWPKDYDIMLDWIRQEKFEKLIKYMS